MIIKNTKNYRQRGLQRDKQDAHLYCRIWSTPSLHAGKLIFNLKLTSLPGTIDNSFRCNSMFFGFTEIAFAPSKLASLFNLSQFLQHCQKIGGGRGPPVVTQQQLDIVHKEVTSVYFTRKKLDEERVNLIWELTWPGPFHHWRHLSAALVLASCNWCWDWGRLEGFLHKPTVTTSSLCIIVMIILIRSHALS